MKKSGHFLLLACFTILLVSCNRATASRLPDQLVVKRIDPLHQSSSEFEKNIDDKKQVLEVYMKLKNLPSFPKGPISCPADNGVQYELSFFHAGNTISQSIIDATGCEGVALNNKHYWTMGPKGQELRALLEQVIGLSESEFRVGFASH